MRLLLSAPAEAHNHEVDEGAYKLDYLSSWWSIVAPLVGMRA